MNDRSTLSFASVLVAGAFTLLLPPLKGQQPPPAVEMVGDTGEGAKYWP